MQRWIIKTALIAFLSLGLIALDQITKWSVTQILFKESAPLDFATWLITAGERTSFHMVDVTPFFNLVMVWNQGVSFGLFNQGSAFGPLILVAVSLMITIAFTLWLFKSTSRLQQSALVLIISGALGNMIDRLRFGAVIDFIDIHVAGHHWPAFNGADSFICIGVGILLLHTLYFENNQTQERETEA